VVARQHKAADALDVVDADGHRLHAWLDERRERRTLTRTGNLEREHRFIRFDGSEHDAAATCHDVVDLGERAVRQRIRRPRHFLKHRRSELGAESQRLLRDHDGLRRNRLRRFDLRAEAGLIVQPDLSDEHSEQAEHDGKPDHYDGTGTHGGKPRLTRPNSSPVYSTEH